LGLGLGLGWDYWLDIGNWDESASIYIFLHIERFSSFFKPFALLVWWVKKTFASTSLDFTSTDLFWCGESKPVGWESEVGKSELEGASSYQFLLLYVSMVEAETRDRFHSTGRRNVCMYVYLASSIYSTDIAVVDA
jgi:hypothetical protein